MKKLILIFSLFSQQIFGQMTTSEIDELVNKTLKTFDVPGISVGIVKDGKLIHAKGYGLRSLNTKLPVNENTNFGIASNSKAFTVAALGMMVDEGKLSWDTKVTDIIPEFKMYDAYVTSEFTVRDLLCHRSGLGLGAGDLMFWPDSSNFTKTDIIHNLRFLKPVSSFRTKYDYDNLMYIVAGEILKKVSGQPWEEFIQKRIFDPLNIKNSAPSYSLLKDKSNVIDPHYYDDGVLKVIRRDWNQNANSAGGIYANVVDMSKWMNLLLNKGKYGEKLENTLISEQTLNEIWTPQTIIPVKSINSYNTHFSSYGLGWFISDVKGYKQLAHSGGLAGIVTLTTLIPELNLAIMVYTNQQSGLAFYTITNSIKDSYLGIKNKDRLKEYGDIAKANKENADQVTSAIWKTIQDKTEAKVINDTAVTATYTDAWFGDVAISMKNGKLWFNSLRSFLLSGEMIYYKGNTYVVKWNNRSMEADAFVSFELDKDGRASGFKMEAISPMTDFSFDFQDLAFRRKQK